MAEAMTGALPLPPGQWTAEALCAQVGGDLWFPGPGEAGIAAAAKAVCAACPVRAPCLEHALQTRELHGIWGGLDYRERRAEQRRRARAAGTLTGAPREHAASPGGSIGPAGGAGPRYRRCGSCGYLLAAPGHAIQCGARKAGAAETARGAGKPGEDTAEPLHLRQVAQQLDRDLGAHRRPGIADAGQLDVQALRGAEEAGGLVGACRRHARQGPPQRHAARA